MNSMKKLLSLHPSCLQPHSWEKLPASATVLYALCYQRCYRIWLEILITCASTIMVGRQKMRNSQTMWFPPSPVFRTLDDHCFYFKDKAAPSMNVASSLHQLNLCNHVTSYLNRAQNCTQRALELANKSKMAGIFNESKCANFEHGSSDWTQLILLSCNAHDMFKAWRWWYSAPIRCCTEMCMADRLLL